MGTGEWGEQEVKWLHEAPEGFAVGAESRSVAWRGALCPGLQRPVPCKSSRAFISHLKLAVHFVPCGFRRWRSVKRVRRLRPPSPRGGSVSAEETPPALVGFNTLPESHRDASSKRHLWAILASTAIVITISNYAELYAFGAYYRHQRGVLFLFSTCSLA